MGGERKSRFKLSIVDLRFRGPLDLWSIVICSDCPPSWTLVEFYLRNTVVFPKCPGIQTMKVSAYVYLQRCFQLVICSVPT